MFELSPETISLLMFAGLLVGLFMGHPLAFVLGGLATIFGCLTMGKASLTMFSNRIFGVMDNYILVAVPLFIFMAQLLDRSGIAQGLFSTMRYLFRSVRGGLAVAVVVVSTLFGACTGIIGASVVTMGLLSLPLMLKYGYDKRMACGVICAGGALGILIPPSIMLVVMGDLSGLSVGRLFAGALVPGLILSCLYIIYILIRCYFNPELGPAASVEELAAISTGQLMKMVMTVLVPPSILILGVLGSIFTGVATPTEASGVGALLALLMMIAYGRFSWKALYECVTGTGRTTAMVVLILAAASCFTSVFLASGGGKAVSNMILGIGLGKWGTFFVMMVIMFVLGMFIDWIGIVLITFPIFLPIVQSLGFDKFWFVVATAVMLQDSFLTPPFGYALFYLKGIAPEEVTTMDIYRGVTPFWELMELALVAVCVFPQTITWLPSVLFD